MLLKNILPLLLGVVIAASADAQRTFTGGFRSGLTFSTLSGPSEMDDQGNELETFSLSSGFHVGATFNFRLTDIFGLRGELMYAQKGLNYDYEGPSYWIFEPLLGTSIYSSGTRQISLDITNSYIELPLTAFARAGRFEISAGISAGILVGSRGFGEVTYSGRSTLGSNIAPFTVNLQHNYFRDSYREEIATEFESRTIEGRPVRIPLTTGAYQEAVDNGQKLFRPLDFGLFGGLSFYLSKTLFLGGRIYYGLPDVTNDQQDISRKTLGDNREYLLRQDDDRNLVFYLSLGFSL